MFKKSTALFLISFLVNSQIQAANMTKSSAALSTLKDKAVFTKGEMILALVAGAGVATLLTLDYCNRFHPYIGKKR